MADPFPTDPKKIRARIRSYERAFHREVAERGDIDDGYGKRYLLGPLYMLMGDVEGALESHKWFEETFPDDCGEPFQYLTWSLALHKAGNEAVAFSKLYGTMLLNLYLVPHVLGEEPTQLDIWHGCNWEWLEYALDLPDRLRALWDDESLAWARSVYDDPRVAKKREQFIEIHRKLMNEQPGPERSRLVREASALSRYEFAENPFQ